MVLTLIWHAYSKVDRGKVGRSVSVGIDISERQQLTGMAAPDPHSEDVHLFQCRL